MLKVYEWTLDQVLKFKSVMMAVTIATLGFTAYLYIIIPKGLFPTEDTGFIIATTTAATDISIPAITELQMKVLEIIRADKAVDYVSSSVGPGGINPTMNKGSMSIALKRRAE